ncbi:MAG: hypothetical protein H0T85_02545 [Geodermatophilaceae bacterium]|nr:hypothetical protein [Geodermatophilaceae bacterium]
MLKIPLWRTVLVLAGVLGLLVPASTASAAPQQPRWVSLEDGLGDYDRPAAVAVSPLSGDVYVVGTKSRATVGEFGSVTSYSRAGAVRWTRPYVSADREDSRAVDVVVDPGDGTVFVLLQVNGAGYESDPVLAAYSPLGRLLWQRTYEAPGDTSVSPRQLELDAARGQLYLLGSGTTFATQELFFTTIAYSVTGDLLWVADYGAPGRSGPPVALSVDPDSGKVVVTGEGDTLGGTATVAYSDDGDELWVAREPRDRLGQASGVATDPQTGNVYITGVTLVPGGVSFYQTIGYGPAGVRLWSRQEAAPSNGSAESAIAIDPASGAVVVASAGAPLLSGVSVALLTRAYASTGRPLWRGTLDQRVDQFGPELPLELAFDPVTRTAHVAVGIVAGSIDEYTVLVGYGPRGEIVRRTTYRTSDDAFPDDLTDLGLDPRTGDVYLTATTNLTGDSGDWLVLAYPPAH